MKKIYCDHCEAEMDYCYITITVERPSRFANEPNTYVTFDICENCSNKVIKGITNE